MTPYSSTVYSHKADFDKIITILKTEFPNSTWDYEVNDEFKIGYYTIKGGFLQKDKKLKISYRERVNPSFELPSAECPLTKNLIGMHNMVKTLPSNDRNVKALLLHKIQTLNSEFSIQALNKAEAEFMSSIKVLVKEQDGIVFAQSQNNISKSNVQHFLNSDLELILDMNGINGVKDLNVEIDADKFDQTKNEIRTDQEIRKEESEYFLQKNEIKVNSNLPTIKSETNTTIRSQKEIAERIVALALTNLVAFNNITGEQAIDFANKHNILQFLTPNEIAFCKDPTPEKKNHETWKCECIWVLSWALKHVEELPFPDTLVNLADIPEGHYPIGATMDPLSFVRSIEQSRSKSEVLNANDLYYRMNWACVDARVKEEQIDKIHPGIVYERHYALNWLINYGGQEWDDVSTET